MTRKEFLGAYNLGYRDGKIEDYCPNDYDDIFDIDQEPKWIPCTERLPKEEYKNYLVSTNDGEVDIGSYGSEKGWSMCDADGFYYPQHRGIEVVAWMPLPKPYKAERKN